jgi:hypothetical protein
MNTAERYYIVDHLEKAIEREKRNVDRTQEEFARAEVKDSPYAQTRARLVTEHYGMVKGLQEALSIVRGLS